MEKVIKNQKTMKCGLAIKIFTVAAFLGALFYYGYFLYCDVIFDVSVPWIMKNVFDEMVHFAPYILFILFVFVFNKKRQATILVPITVGLFAILELVSDIRYYYDYAGYFFPIDNYIHSALLDASLIMAFICSLKGFDKKVLFAVAMSVHLALNSYWFVCKLNDISFLNFNFDTFIWLLYNLFLVFFDIAFLLFGLTNKIPSVISLVREKTKLKTLNSEQALLLLKDDFDSGVISNEEYQVLRTKIINRI